MLIDGESLNVKSGPGTSMFSRTGASTIPKYKIFSSKFTTIDELVIEAKTKKTARRKNLGDDDSIVDELTDKLPVIGFNEDNQRTVEVPGLAEELAKVGKSYKEIQAERIAGTNTQWKKNDSANQTIKTDVSGSAFENFMKPIDYDSLSKLTRAQFEELKAAQKSER